MKLLAIVLFLLSANVFAAGTADFPPFDASPWLGKTRTTLQTQVSAYRGLCERRISHAVSTLTPDFKQNELLTKQVCDCTTAHFNTQKDVNYVHVVNLELRGARASMKPMPTELSLYVANYNLAEIECVNSITAKNRAAANLKAPPAKPNSKIQPRRPTSTQRRPQR